MQPSAMKSPPKSATPAGDPDRTRKLGLYLGVVGTILALDIVTKYMVTQRMTLYRPIPIWGDVFRLTYIYNKGAAFGLHLGVYSRFVFLILAVVAVFVLWRMYSGTPWADRTRLLAIALVTGGALGNLIDRVRWDRGVVDFLDFDFPDLWMQDFRWPVFNVADIAVTTGAVLLAISLWREEQLAEHESKP